MKKHDRVIVRHLREYQINKHTGDQVPFKGIITKALTDEGYIVQSVKTGAWYNLSSTQVEPDTEDVILPHRQYPATPGQAYMPNPDYIIGVDFVDDHGAVSVLRTSDSHLITIRSIKDVSKSEFDAAVASMSRALPGSYQIVKEG